MYELALANIAAITEEGGSFKLDDNTGISEYQIDLRMFDWNRTVSSVEIIQLVLISTIDGVKAW